MKTFKQNSLTVVLVVVSLSLSMALAVLAEDRMDPVGSNRIKMEEVVDTYIKSREAKTKMMDSKSEAIKASATLSCDKAEFCKLNRDQLVDELLAKGYEPNPQKVFPFLHRKFFESRESGVYARTP